MNQRQIVAIIFVGEDNKGIMVEEDEVDGYMTCYYAGREIFEEEGIKTKPKIKGKKVKLKFPKSLQPKKREPK